jgi:hypothetical protein
LVLEYWDWHDKEDESSVDERADAMLTILSQTSGALRIIGEALSMTPVSYHMAASISWDGFAAMARCSGYTLREFSVKIESTMHPSAAVFADLVALRILEWKCGASFLLTDIPQDGFPNLEDLRISSADESFLTALSLMEYALFIPLLLRLLTSHVVWALYGVLPFGKAALTSTHFSMLTVPN